MVLVSQTGKWIALISVAVAGFFLARMIRSGFVDAAPHPAPAAEMMKRPRISTAGIGKFSEALVADGAEQLPRVRGAILGAGSAAELERFAVRLLAEETAAPSESLWALLLARWSEIDPAGMVVFLEGMQGHGALPELEEMAWFAWGAVDPEAAFQAVKTRSSEFRRKALAGMVETFPEQAMTFALQMPDAQFVLRGVVQSGRLSPESLEYLETRSVYDGARMPVQKARVAQLAESDPAAAIELAQRAGRIWTDQVADAFSVVARHDPAAAVELLNELPDSRRRALSQLEVARTWAAQDTDAALRWARETMTEPVLQSALVEIAAVVGGKDPLAGLALVEEAGWGEVGKFYGFVEAETDSKGRLKKGQSHDHATSTQVAMSLIRQLATADPDAAREYIASVRGAPQEELMKAAGLDSSATSQP